MKLAFERGLDSYGVDISAYALKKGRELNPRIINRLSVRRAEDVEKIFGKERFDVITALEVLEHIPNPKEALSSIYNVLS